MTMRMSMRRFTRLTNGFSKKLENLKAAVGLHFSHYNFVRLHKTLRTTPAMGRVFLIGFGRWKNWWSRLHEILANIAVFIRFSPGGGNS